MNSINLPFVSVIVPVYNDEKRIEKCIKSLLNQNYPKNRLEIIIINNNSNDKTVEIIEKYPVRLLHENDVQSSYAARNKGIKNSKGEILAFTDSDCIADKNWLTNGVNCFIEKNIELLAGDVKFFYKEKYNIFEIYDSVKNIDQEWLVFKKNKAATANLFVRDVVFKKVGLFDDRLVSGGDGVFVNLSISFGFKLDYYSNSIVFHPARDKNELFKKARRIGYSQIKVWIFLKKNIFFILSHLIFSFFPQFKLFRKKLEKIDKNNFKIYFLLFFINWYFNSLMNFYRFVYLRDLITSKIK